MTAKKTLDKPSVVDELADDAAPPEYPEGAPELVPFLQVRPRGRRAEVKRKFAEFQLKRDKLLAMQELAGLTKDELDAGKELELTPEQEQARMSAWADADEVMQMMDDVMRMCASDPAAYDAWSAEADDDALTATFNAFVSRSQPGEASSSTS